MTGPFPSRGFNATDLATCYERDGYIVLKDVFSAEEVEALRPETVHICKGDRGEVIGTKIVSEDIISSEEAMQRVLAIHFPHKISGLMKSTLTKPEIVAALNVLIGPDLKCMQSMLFVKNAGKPGQAWHQDEHYIPTRDQSLAGVWIALDDAREDNGGLWMHPGSHKHGILWPTQPHNDERFDIALEAHGYPYEREGGVSVDADAGDVVIFHGYVLHRSLKNTRKTGYRRALVNHVMSARSLLPWSIGIPPEPRTDFRDFEMVSGEDPYAWKGKEEKLVPFIRPDDPASAAKVFAELIASSSDKT